jgi:enoyl-CoA hydratase/carnithine racemase
VEKEEGFWTLIINRPEKRNSLTPDLLLAMKDVLDSLSDHTDVRAVVITGAGDKAFSAGFDIGALPTKVLPGTEDELKTNVYVDACMESIASCPYPVIAMIDGYARGAGCELALSCDIRIASERASFGMPPAKLGLVYSAKGTKKFINAVGFANTKEIFLTGRPFDAQRAKEMGFVSYVVPAEQLKEFAYEMAREISENAPLSLRGTKTIISYFMNMGQLGKEEEAHCAKLRFESLKSNDLKEGRKAFKEKRKPTFRGE